MIESNMKNNSKNISENNIGIKLEGFSTAQKHTILTYFNSITKFARFSSICSLRKSVMKPSSFNTVKTATRNLLSGTVTNSLPAFCPLLKNEWQ